MSSFSFGIASQQIAPPENVAIDSYEKAFDTELKGEIFYAVQDSNNKRVEPLQLQRHTINGYKALQERLKDEKKECETIVGVVSKMNSIANANYEKVANNFESDILEIESKNIELSKRLLLVQKKLEVLMAQNKPNLSGKDLELQTKLLNLEQELQKPDQYIGKLNELAPKLELQQNIASIPSTTNISPTQSNVTPVSTKIKDLFDLSKLNITSSPSPQNNQEAFSLEQKQLLEQFLEEQTKGIQKLIETLQEDIEDLQFIQTEMLQNASQ